jgi:hypothetical protein
MGSGACDNVYAKQFGDINEVEKIGIVGRALGLGWHCGLRDVQRHGLP